ncbi:MAG: hypothetical protein HQ581_22475, partial [Planctomycetes bacterium]|nr:hypothetical protein [Planctomycetota bacterium]
MPINVTCKCGQKFNAKDALAGKQVKCPVCKEPLTIPAAEKRAAEEPAAEKPAPIPTPASDAADDLFGMAEDDGPVAEMSIPVTTEDVELPDEKPKKRSRYAPEPEDDFGFKEEEEETDGNEEEEEEEAPATVAAWRNWKEWPRWARITIPTVGLLVVAAAIYFLYSGDNKKPRRGGPIAGAPQQKPGTGPAKPSDGQEEQTPKDTDGENTAPTDNGDPTKPGEETTPPGGTEPGTPATTPGETPATPGSGTPAEKPPVKPTPEESPLPQWSDPIALTSPDVPIVFAPGSGTSRRRSRTTVTRPGTSSRSRTSVAGLSEFVAVGSTVFDLATGEKVGKIEGQAEFEPTHRALSADGLLFAVAYLKKTRAVSGAVSTESLVDIIDCEEGELLKTLELSSKSASGRPVPLRMSFMRFLGSDRLLCAGRQGVAPAVTIWDIETGELDEGFQSEEFDRHTVAISPDGKHLATVISTQVMVYDMGQGKEVGPMPMPEGRSRAPFLNCRGAAYSPDGKELAVLIPVKDSHRIICWGGQGKDLEVVFDQTFETPLPGDGSEEAQIQWTPEASGWLVCGRHVVDRETKRVVWMRTGGSTIGGTPRFIAPMAVCVGGETSEGPCLAPAEVPMEGIFAAIEVMESDGEVVLRPGDSVSLKVEVVGEVKRAGSEAKVHVTQRLTELLAANEIEVAEGQPLLLEARYWER